MDTVCTSTFCQVPQFVVWLLTQAATGGATVGVVSLILSFFPSEPDKNTKRLVAYSVALALGAVGWYLLARITGSNIPTDVIDLIIAILPSWFANYSASQAWLMGAKTWGVSK